MAIERVERARKPIKCPKCGFRPVATILFGMPCFDEELEQELKAGTVALGGCVIGGDDPVWQCSACGLEIYRKPK